jgi:hypothetical protein
MTLFVFIIFAVTLGIIKPRDASPQTYIVKKASGPIRLSGKGDDPRWREADTLSDFSYPWDRGTPQPTAFLALHDEQWVYFLFHVTDDDVHIAAPDTNDKLEVASSSRAEIFFRIDERLDPYYCLEIDPKGRVLDYEATYHRSFDFKWSWPAGALRVQTSMRRDGYSIELAISKTSLRDLSLLKNNTLHAGVFRANCKLKSNGEPEFEWISWKKPDSESPDFHIPSSFGIFQLQD